MDASSLSDLIGTIYDCAIDPTLWPSTLGRIADVFDSPAGTLNVLDIVTGTERTLAYTGISDAYQALYHARYQGSDLFAHGMLLQPIAVPATSDDLVTEAELLGSRIYREWAAPQGFRHVMLTALIRSQARLAFLGLTRRHDQARYGAWDRERMALLAPHVRRAVVIADLIEHRTLGRDDLAATLDALNVAVLVVGGESRLVYANAAGAAALDRGDLLAAPAGRLDPWDRASAADLRAILATGAAGTITLARRGGGSAVLSALPLRPGRRTVAGGSGRVALFIQDAAHGPNAVEALGRAYRLTGAELRVLLGLAEDETPKEIAARYGIAPSTVHTHLKSLFAKTGARRQKDLVRLLLAIPPAGAAAGSQLGGPG